MEEGSNRWGWLLNCLISRLVIDWSSARYGIESGRGCAPPQSKA